MVSRSPDPSLTAESELGAGTAFYLPVSGKEIFAVEHIAEEDVCFGKGKVLFMDDEQDVIDAAEWMLTQIGYEIEIVKNGIEAVELYKKAKEAGEPFDAVILDLTIQQDSWYQTEYKTHSPSIKFFLKQTEVLLQQSHLLYVRINNNTYRKAPYMTYIICN